jgi:hypothetical protein
VSVLATLGSVHRESGQLAETIVSCEEALAITGEIVDRYEQACALFGIAETQRDIGNRTSARALLKALD